MKKTSSLIILLLIFCSFTKAQDLRSRWDELTASEWPKALAMSNQTCILPIGILEKQGTLELQNEFFNRVKSAP
jgi:creatinine amidohydrolase